MPLKTLVDSTISPRFELAFRRCLFLLIVLSGYLFVGALIFTILFYEQQDRAGRLTDAKIERLDFARAELLNVLWAESIGRGEHDWSLLANQKMDAYELILLRAYPSSGGGVEKGRGSQPGYWDWLHHAFLLITTIGMIYHR